MTDNPYTWGNGQVGKTFFEIISQEPRRIQQFNIAMSTQDFTLPVLGMYPFGEELANASDLENRALIVDIGGGRGHSLIQIRERWPDLKGRMILQDRPVVLDSIGELPGIEKMAHDFFTEQPVKRELFFFFFCILPQDEGSDEGIRCPRILHSSLSA